MFNKASLTAALLAALPLASAFKLNGPPSNPTSGGEVTIKWSAEAGDPQTFDLELTNEIFHNTYAIANTVSTGAGSITLVLPDLQAGDGYAIVAHQVGNVNGVLDTTSQFNVGATTTTGTSTGTSSTSSSTSGKTTSSTSAVLTSTQSTSAFGTTVKASTTAPAASASSAAAATTSAASNSASHIVPTSVFGAIAALMVVFL